MKYSEKLYHRYLAEIAAWDWQDIKAELQSNVYEDDDGNMVGSCYIGSILSLAPSGKYYTFWTSNQTAKDVIKDEAFFKALEELADKNDMYLSSGEGDLCDLYLQATIAD
jgi:hypothetical protein